MKALKVVIRLTADGKSKYPDFDSLAVILATGYKISAVGRKDKWSRYIDKEALGVLYDQTSGHTHDSVDSPKGVWLAVLVVPDEFADQAVAAFDECTILNDTDAGAFYESKVSIYDPDEVINAQVLADIKAKEDLSLPLTQAQIDAKDPSSDQPGVVTSKTKTWSALKATNSFTVS